jgi:eukaryotic-like serine/threonine-protein kinase
VRDKINIALIVLGIVLWMITCAGIVTHVNGLVVPGNRVAPPPCQEDMPPDVKNGIGALYEPLPSSPERGEYIGISDGTFAFDISGGRPGAAYKCRAAELFRLNKSSQEAVSCWTQAIRMDPNDAEALIYRQDQHVLENTDPGSIITLIVGVTLTGNRGDVRVGRDTLQGAYVAQEMYNRTSKYFKIYLFIANFGSQANNAPLVANQIVQVVQANQTFNKTIRGIVGFPFISNTKLAATISNLEQMHIPIILPTGFIGAVNEQGTNIFHVGVPVTREGEVGARYIERRFAQVHGFSVKRLIVFVDPKDLYSEGLAKAFEQTLLRDGSRNIIVGEEDYAVGDPNSILSDVNQISGSSLDLIYFAGKAADADVLLQHLPTVGPFDHLRVMGGDGLYELGGYSVAASYRRLDFTAFAYPDEWVQQRLLQHPFFDAYALNFAGWPPDKAYGFTRPDSDAILGYDAASMLLGSIPLAAEDYGDTSSDSILRALSTVSGSHAFQEFSGVISLGSDRNPMDKTVVVLYVDDSGLTQLVALDGCLRPDSCSSI